jgi:hypothetical protein
VALSAILPGVLMANRRLSMRKIEEVLRLHHDGGRTNREIAQVIRSSPTTVGEYLRRARVAGIGWPLPAGMTELALEAALFPMPAPDYLASQWAGGFNSAKRSAVRLMASAC